VAYQPAWVLGHHAVEAVLRGNPERALSLWVAINPKNKSQRAILNQVEGLGLPINPVDKRELARRCGSDQHQGVALQAKPKNDGGDQELASFIELFDQRRWCRRWPVVRLKRCECFELLIWRGQCRRSKKREYG